MAIRFTKQNWDVGNMVNVGFLRLEVRGYGYFPGHCEPDSYYLTDPKTGKDYTFTPHKGLEKGWV